jgi:hypothetical protein
MLNDHQEVNASLRRLLLFEKALKRTINPNIGDPRSDEERNPCGRRIERRVMQDVKNRSWSRQLAQRVYILPKRWV